MFFNHDDEVYGVAFSHNGNYVATISADNTVKVWNRANGHEIARFVYDSDDVPDVNTVIFSADDRYITVAVRNQDAQTWLWNACDLIEASRDRLTIADLTPED